MGYPQDHIPLVALPHHFETPRARRKRPRKWLTCVFRRILCLLQPTKIEQNILLSLLTGMFVFSAHPYPYGQSDNVGDKAMSLRNNLVRVVSGDGGFGFVIAERPDGFYIVTTAHVVLADQPESQNEIRTVFYSDRGTRYKATVLQQDHNHDLALLRVKIGPRLTWNRHCLAAADEAKRGTAVWFIGRDETWYVPVANGFISSQTQSVDGWLEADLDHLRPGSSGAPLVTNTGVIGMLKAQSADDTRTLSITYIKSKVQEWGYPWDLTSGAASPSNEAVRTPSSPAREPGYSSQTRLFSDPVSYKSGGKNPNSVAVGDFNGDGKLDIAVANSSTNNVGVLLGNGDGTFQIARTYDAGDTPYAIRVGDFNHDGKLDIAVTNVSYSGASPSLSLLLGNGDGTFQAARNFTAGVQPTDFVLGDFNRDGNLDVAVANRIQRTVNVLLGTGDGSLKEPVAYGVKEIPLYGVAAGDVNGDGKLDVAVANHHYVSILLGRGDGTFDEAQNYLANTGSWGAYSVALADLDGDKKLDLAVTNFSNASVGVLLGNGDGSFQDPRTYPTDEGPFYVATADLNGDGKIDLVTANNSNTVSILLGNGDGSFQTAQNYAAGFSPCFLVVGDFNEDGRPDLVVPDRGADNIAILLNISGTTAITLTSSSDPSLQGESVTFTAQVAITAGATPGVVEFRSDNDLLGTKPVVDGFATVTTAALPPGSHIITARYISSSPSLHDSATLRQLVK